MSAVARHHRDEVRTKVLGRRLDPRANSLNFLRLLLATTVIGSHAVPLGAFGKEPLLADRSPGGYAVYGFFALSGYLIMGSRLNSSFGGFLRRRLLRLYPGFVALLLCTVLLFAPTGYLTVHGTLDGYVGTPNTPLDFLAANLDLRVNGTSIAGTPVSPHGWAVTLWTLYYEFLCYLVVGLLAFWSLFRRNPLVNAVLLSVLTIVQIYVDAFVRYAGNADLLHMVDLLPYFLAGVIVYQLRDRLVATWWTAVPACAVVVAVPALLEARFVVLMALPLAFLLLSFGALVPVPLGRTNDISYGMYLYQGPVQQLLTTFGLNEHGFVLYVILSVVGTLPFAAASWVLVERPVIRLARRRPAAPANPTVESSATITGLPTAQPTRPAVPTAGPAADVQLRRAATAAPDRERTAVVPAPLVASGAVVD